MFIFKTSLSGITVSFSLFFLFSFSLSSRFPAPYFFLSLSTITIFPSSLHIGSHRSLLLLCLSVLSSVRDLHGISACVSIGKCVYMCSADACVHTCPLISLAASVLTGKCQKQSPVVEPLLPSCYNCG